MEAIVETATQTMPMPAVPPAPKTSTVKPVGAANLYEQEKAAAAAARAARPMPVRRPSQTPYQKRQAAPKQAYVDYRDQSHPTRHAFFLAQLLGAAIEGKQLDVADAMTMITSLKGYHQHLGVGLMAELLRGAVACGAWTLPDAVAYLHSMPDCTKAVLQTLTQPARGGQAIALKSAQAILGVLRVQYPAVEWDKFSANVYANRALCTGDKREQLSQWFFVTEYDRRKWAAEAVLEDA